MEQSIDSTRPDRQVTIVLIPHIRLKKINSVDRYCLHPFSSRVDCIEQLTVDRIDRYDRRRLLRATVCVNQLTVDRSDDRRWLLRAKSTVNVLFIAPTSGNHSVKLKL